MARGRTSDYPTSANRASSFHLRWDSLPPDAALVEVSADLEVLDAPRVADLYFWALQASFAGQPGSAAAHLGLQWYPPHPGSTAVNWGGYGPGGGILDGTDSPLPSATGNPNTRDLAWEPGRRYRLAIAGGSRPGWWRGSVDGIVLRELHGGGDRLAAPIVWAEVFARCDAPPVAVRWSDFAARTALGAVVEPASVVVSYQEARDGGCDNTTVLADGPGAFVQRTASDRQVPPGAVLPVR
jgi:hypothetical protein